MPTAGFQPPQGQQSVAQLQDWIIKLCRDLDYYMNNLDDTNVNRLTAQKIFVNELSAISANLGTIIAGSITTNAQINIGTDATVGNNIYVGNNSPTSNSKMVLNGGSSLESNYGAGSISMKSNNQVSLASLGNVTMQASGNVIVVSAGGTVSDLVGAINYLMSQVPSGFTGSQSVITSVNFGTSTTTSKTLNFTNGVLTSIT